MGSLGEGRGVEIWVREGIWEFSDWFLNWDVCIEYIKLDAFFHHSADFQRSYQNRKTANDRVFVDNVDLDMAKIHKVYLVTVSFAPSSN